MDYETKMHHAWVIRDACEYGGQADVLRAVNDLLRQAKMAEEPQRYEAS